MNNNYNFNINPDKLKSQQIEQHKDFETLLKKYQESPSPKKAHRPKLRWLKLIGSTAAAACIGFAIYMTFLKPSETYVNPDAYFASQDFINPPFKNIKASFAQYKVKANQGGIYKYKNGSQLIIPPAAFINQKGEIVKGEVDIKYREFHDFVDFFISGIPMEYDSAGTKYNLESAGMIEIYAEQNGQRLSMTPGKNIDIELISQINVAPKVNVPPSYNIYKLDTKQRKWLYKGVDNIAFLAANQNNANQQYLTMLHINFDQKFKIAKDRYEAALAQLEASIPMPEKPIQPMKANGSDHAFNLDFDVNEITPVSMHGESFQEEAENKHLKNLKEKYGNIYWQIAPNNPAIDEQTKRTLWEDVQIKALNDKDYELTLIQANRRVKVIVNPVLMANDFEKAMANYKLAYANYQKLMEVRNAQLASKKQALATNYSKEKASIQKTLELEIEQLKNKDDAAPKAKFVSQKVINKFKANSFGIWNCDRPIPPATAKVSGSFIDNSQQKHHHRTAFLADKSKNTIARFYAQKGCQVHYDQNADNLLWLVTPDNKIAVFRPENFKRINQSKDDFTFAVKVVEKEIKSEQDIRDILKFEL